MDISKNRQSDETIRRLVSSALDLDVCSIRELTAGQCNALYDLNLGDGSRVVLKIAGTQGLRRGERWLMTGEVEAMTLAAERTDLPVPRILCYDDSRRQLPAPFLVMEYMPGNCLGEECRHWSAQEKNSWYQKIGQCIRSISGIRGDHFGIVSCPEKFADLFSFVRWFFLLLLEDAKEYGVDLGIPDDLLLDRLEQSRHAFEEVTESCLVHYDIWENNLMGQDGRISGILDWERALWAEPLMEERFRSYAVNRALCEGFGKTEFTLAETERMLWYDLLMDAALMVDVFARKYASTAQYDRAKARFAAAFARLNAALEAFVPKI